MKALICKQFGLPNTLTVEEVASPVVKHGEVRIRVRAAGINFPDVLLVQGLYQLKPPFPFSPGMEVAGEVLEVGEGVTDRVVGQRVIGIVNFGGLAEEVCAPAVMTLPMPEKMSYVHGAVFPIAYGTSHVALAHRAHVKVGETLLVLGAAGGVGLTAVQIGKRMGAVVIAAASTDEKLALAVQVGADHTINYTRDNLRDEVRRMTHERGADVIYDPVGGDLFDQAHRVIAWEGRYLVIGFATGRIPELAINKVLLKNSTLMGTFWGAYAQHQPQVMAESFRQLLAWVEVGHLKPHIGATFTLDDSKQALNLLMNRGALGKVVVTA